jgi:predicted nucleic acid-binding protein
MTALVFVDSNVFLYARDASEPAKQPRAAGWLDFLWHDRSGRTSVQALSEYYVNVTRKLTPGLAPDDAWDDVTALLTWRPLPVDAALLQRGREIERRHRLSWWDSLILGAAQLQGCGLLLSEDFQDGGVYGSVTVRSPFTFAINDVPSAYGAAPLATSGHPRRGRPKRSQGSAA